MPAKAGIQYSRRRVDRDYGDYWIIRLRG